jgi:hypothetical protein
MRISQTFGPNAVDWESWFDVGRLRAERLARLKAELGRSDLGALLSFDFANIRYMTSTHIGTWAMDKLIRFALLPRGGEPVVWDFGSAARHHQLYNPWLDHSDGPPTPGGAVRTGARAGISTLRGAFHPAACIAEDVAAKVVAVLREHGLADGPVIRRSSTSCTATLGTGPATTGRSPWAVRPGRSATPTCAAASTWIRRSHW